MPRWLQTLRSAVSGCRLRLRARRPARHLQPGVFAVIKPSIEMPTRTSAGHAIRKIQQGPRIAEGRPIRCREAALRRKRPGQPPDHSAGRDSRPGPGLDHLHAGRLHRNGPSSNVGGGKRPGSRTGSVSQAARRRGALRCHPVRPAPKGPGPSHASHLHRRRPAQRHRRPAPKGAGAESVPLSVIPAGSCRTTRRKAPMPAPDRVHSKWISQSKSNLVGLQILDDSRNDSSSGRDRGPSCFWP